MNTIQRIKPKKRFGQNFLIDKNIIRKIIGVAAILPDETVVEIGAGTGLLTRELALKAKKVIAFEIDNNLYKMLCENFKEHKNIEFINEDALTFDYSRIGERFKIVANLPYYISTPLIFRFLEMKYNISEMILMVQREVAERIIAMPGVKDYGILSIAVNYYAISKIGFYVSKTCFRPIPKVDSAIITLRPLENKSIKVMNEELFFKVVRSAFNYRRKYLMNALCEKGFPQEKIIVSLKSCNIDQKRRAETLTIGDFAQLADTLFLSLK